MASLDRVYEKDFDLKKLTSVQKKKFMKHRLRKFPVAAIIILHIITLGIFTWIYFGIVHGRLPKIKKNDFGAVKAILFWLIPFFNIYWMFIFWLRLHDRVNFQLKLRGKGFELPRELVLAVLIINLIPFISYINLVLIPLITGLMQTGINQIARK